MGIAWDISHGFSTGKLDLAARPNAPAVGWEALPESQLASQLRSRGANAATIRSVLTFLASMDRARDAVALWNRGFRLYLAAPWAYSPAEVVKRSLTELADALIQPGVSQRHLADSAAWRRIAETLHASSADRPVRRVIEEGKGTADNLRSDLASQAPGGSANFPFLGGPKVGPMWIRMMVVPGGASVSDLQIIPVAVDVQVKRVTENLGITDTGRLEVELARRPIQDAWMRLARAEGVDAPGELAGTCAGLDPALWFYGKYGCMHCEDRRHRVPIYQTCSACRLPEAQARVRVATQTTSQSPGHRPSAEVATREGVDGRPVIGLVGCVKTKLDHAAPARDLYVSDLFLGRRRAVENRTNQWFIISAQYGLVEPDDLIEPYDLSLADLTRAERREWARGVLAALQAKLGDLGRYSFEIHAGGNYFDFGLAEGLRAAGASVVIPTIGLSQGEQLRHYSAATKESTSAQQSAAGPARAAGKYEAIGEMLDESQSSEVRLSLEEIEELIGAPLPPSARAYQAWWYGAKPGSLPWTRRGWSVSPRLREGVVLFHKTDAAVNAVEL